MTHQDYLDQNSLGFEGDTIAKSKFLKLITDNSIKTVIETGTFRGATTKHFANWVQNVHSIEVDDNNFKIASEQLHSFPNVTLYHGSSEKVLDEILKNMSNQELIFIFLDAHWQEYNPLIDELKVIAKYGFKPIIAIHDFKVPHHPELGFDVYGDITYEWDWIKDAVNEIYAGVEFQKEYNIKAEGAKRGIVYLYPNTIEQ